jgi:hypothetical protein
MNTALDIVALVTKSSKHGDPIPDWEYWMIVCLIIILVLLGGIVAGTES